MNLTRCRNGHFYDEDRYDSCPHCGNANQADNLTEPMARNDSVTVGIVQNQNSVDDAPTRAVGASLSEAVSQASASPSVNLGVSDDSKTVSYYHKAMGTNPVVGWLVCVAGENIGEDYRLVAGRNFIGRSPSMDIVLAGDNSVARDRHAVIVYDPKSLCYLMQAGEAKELSYLNDKVVLGAQELKAGDELLLGSTKLRFFPCMSSDFNWEMLVDSDKGAHA